MPSSTRLKCEYSSSGLLTGLGLVLFGSLVAPGLTYDFTTGQIQRSAEPWTQKVAVILLWLAVSCFFLYAGLTILRRRGNEEILVESGTVTYTNRRRGITISAPLAQRWRIEQSFWPPFENGGWTAIAEDGTVIRFTTHLDNSTRLRQILTAQTP